MNENLYFWKTWDKNEKIPLLSVGILILLSLIYALFAWHGGLENVIKWDVVSELKEKIITTPVFTQNNLSFSASSPVMYLKERYLPSLLEVNVCANYLLLAGGLLGLVLFLTGTSRLKSTWFLVGVLVLAMVVICFRLENVFLSNSNSVFLICFAALGVAYYLSNYFQNKLNPSKVLLCWLVILVMFLGIVYKYTKINQPFMAMAAYGSIAFLILTLLFIFFISHEILAGLVWLVSKNSQKDKSSLLQYLIISLVYFANAILVYLENSKTISGSILIVPPIFIYGISLILGFWGFKKLIEQMAWFSFKSAGMWIYLGLALISTLTIAFSYATANDSLHEFLEDYIAICQLAVGITFFFYVLVNYIQLFKKGLDVQKVLYKSPFSRLILARIAALFIIVLLFANKNYYSYYQINAGYNNAIADFYLKEGDLKSAETFYKYATHFDLYNQKSNMSLASLALSQNDKINAAFFYKQSLEKSPTAFAFAGLSASLENENLLFESMFNLQKGLKVFPEDNKLHTNYAYLQGKTNSVDSTLLDLQGALKNCNKCEVENTNILAFWIENAKAERLQEMANITKASPYYSYQANLAAVNRILNKPYELSNFDFPKDSTLDVSRAALIANISCNVKSKSNLNAATIKKLQQKASNDPYFEDLSWSFANQNYFKENKLEGMKQLTLLANSNSKLKNVYNQNLGLWLIKEGVYKQGVDRLGLAGDENSVKILNENNFKSSFESELATKAMDITKSGLSLNNYQTKLNDAPLNSYLVVKVCDFLSAKKKDVEAYNLVFYISDLNSDSPLIWKTYIEKAVAISQFDYAKEGLNRYKMLVSPAEFGILNAEVLSTEAKMKANKFE